MREIELVTPLHKQTKRNYLARMNDDKVHCMLKAKEYGYDYWDGDRRYGYGGYKYDGRWKPIAEKLIETYGLKFGDLVLDAGCGKGHLLYELQELGMRVKGFDISHHALVNAPAEVRTSVGIMKAQDYYPCPDKYYDLVISLGCLHNLRIFDLERAIKEIERVGKQKYIMVESCRNEQELFNLQCWALTAESFFDRDEWVWLYKHFGYTGDYEFVYFE